VESSLAPEVTANLIPTATERLGLLASQLPTFLEGSRFLYFNHANRCLLTSHPCQTFPGVQAWPAPSIFFLKVCALALRSMVFGAGRFA
jgi:hypothetical protein